MAIFLIGFLGLVFGARSVYAHYLLDETITHTKPGTASLHILVTLNDVLD